MLSQIVFPQILHTDCLFFLEIHDWLVRQLSLRMDSVQNENDQLVGIFLLPLFELFSQAYHWEGFVQLIDDQGGDDRSCF